MPRQAALQRALALSKRSGLEGEVSRSSGESVPRAPSRHWVSSPRAASMRALPFRSLIGSADADLSVVGSRGLPLVGAAPDVRVRDAAIETGLFFGLRSALAASRRLAASGEPSTVAFLDELEADPESKRGRT